MIHSFEHFDEAAKVASEHGLSVCGTFRGETPLYFLAPLEATDDQLRELSFEAQNGRPMAEHEIGLMKAALQERPESLAATSDDLVAAAP